jgi:hypothetical protein
MAVTSACGIGSLKRVCEHRHGGSPPGERRVRSVRALHLERARTPKF